MLLGHIYGVRFIFLFTYLQLQVITNWQHYWFPNKYLILYGSEFEIILSFLGSYLLWIEKYKFSH